MVSFLDSYRIPAPLNIVHNNPLILSSDPADGKAEDNGPEISGSNPAVTML